MLRIVEHLHDDVEGSQSVDKRRHRTVAFAPDLNVLAINPKVGGELMGTGLGGRHAAHQLDAGHLQVLAVKQIPDLVMADLAGLIVGVILHCTGEFDLQTTRQVDLVLGLQEVGHAALTGLTVDTNDSLVGAPDVVWVDGQVGGLPVNLVDTDALLLGLAFEVLQTFLDSVLVRARKGCEDEVAGVGLACRHR